MSPTELHTDRLLLQQVGVGDAEIVFRALSHPEIIRYYGVSYQTREAAQEQMKWYASLQENNTGIWWILKNKYSGEKIGGCGFNNMVHQHRKTEMGYWLLPEFQGQGIMREALTRAIRYVFEEKNIHRIEALVEPPNRSSKKLLHNLGFSFEGCMKDCEIKNGAFISLEIYALLNKVAEHPKD